MPLKNPLICAIDTQSIIKALDIVDAIKDTVAIIKLGLEFFIAFGAEGIKKISKLGVPIFLDLKLHDIPNTVSRAISALPTECISYLTVHISGGKNMLSEAAKAATDKNISLIGVTLLTSIESEHNTTDNVIKMSELALESGLNYIVCSLTEVAQIKKMFPTIITIVPGIRMNNSEKDDHKRSGTPKQAIKNGADYLVIGRPITESTNPIQTIQEILKSISCE